MSFPMLRFYSYKSLSSIHVQILTCISILVNWITIKRICHYVFRAMDFLVELFRNLLEHGDWAMSQACSDSYSKTLKKFHGWLASSSFSVTVSYALNFASSAIDLEQLHLSPYLPCRLWDSTFWSWNAFATIDLSRENPCWLILVFRLPILSA